MRKFKINRTDKKAPKMPNANRYKDFSKLSHEYDNYLKRQKKPLYKNKKSFFILLLIILIVYLISLLE